MFYFGVGWGHLPDRAERIARRYGAALDNYTDSQGRTRHRFVVRMGNDNENALVQNRVLADVQRAGIDW